MIAGDSMWLTVWRSLRKKMRVVNAERMKKGQRHKYASNLPSMSPEEKGHDHITHMQNSLDGD